MKIGLLCCFYNCASDIDKLLAPWRQVPNCVISIVHGQFKEYHELGYEDKDLETLHKLLDTDCDFLYVQNQYFSASKSDYIFQTEAEIRDKGLQFLIKQGIDVVWLLDNDEFYTLEQIQQITTYINEEDNKLFSWYAINFKNYILNGKQWIDGFAPPRIFKTLYNSIQIDKFYWDNDILYKNALDGVTVNYKFLANKVIPRRIAHVRHMTWLHWNGKSKVEYQNKHFGACSYKWIEETQEIAINEDYFLKTGKPLPIINIE